MTTNGDPRDGNPLLAADLPAIPDVTLLGELARGGMGIVYRGRQDFLERDVAVKLLSPHLHDDRFAARFRREAKLLAGIKHPHIVACHAAGVTPAGQHYLVMELVEGPTLEQWILRHGPVPVPSAARLVGQLASALGHATSLGVIHRDIKTANILLESPSGTSIDARFPFVPKLVDLGLARLVAGHADLAQTAPGAVMGTPATMAPEQFDAPDTVDFRADIYGLGCVLYEMLTGAPPYDSLRLTDLVVAKRQPRGPDPCARGQGIPAPLGQLVAAMLAQDPADRPADYATLRARLAAAIQTTPAVTTPANGNPPVAGNLPAVVEPSATADRTPLRAAGPNLLQTAEFAYLAADGVVASARPPGGPAFTSRVVEGAGKAPLPVAVAAPTIGMANAPRVIGAKVVAVTPVRRPRGGRRWAAAAALLAAAALPFWSPQASEDSGEPGPASAARLPVEVRGLDGALPRGQLVSLHGSARGGVGPLQYEWAVQPAGAATLSAPHAAATSLRHDRLPGDEFTVSLTVGDGHDCTTARQQVVVNYPPRDLLADFLGPDAPWQPAGRQRLAWRQRDDGAVVALAGEQPCLRTHELHGSVWRIGGMLVPERADARTGGHAGFAQGAVCVRIGPQRQLAILCMRDGPEGEHWKVSVQQVVHEDGRGGIGVRPLPTAASARIETMRAKGATFTITRRGDQLRLQIGFPGRREHGEFVETLGDGVRDVPLTLFARAGRVAFPELSLW